MWLEQRQYEIRIIKSKFFETFTNSEKSSCMQRQGDLGGSWKSISPPIIIAVLSSCIIIFICEPY